MGVGGFGKLAKPSRAKAVLSRLSVNAYVARSRRTWTFTLDLDMIAFVGCTWRKCRLDEAGEKMKVVVLAAGQGSRLGETQPKTLTRLSNGDSILQRQIEALLPWVSLHDIYIVVGFKKEMIMEAIPHLLYVYNERYHVTNTAKSLLAGLRKAGNDDVMWINGDVVLESEVIGRIARFHDSCMGVNEASVADEEVKYSLAPDGSICQVSKHIDNALGEALGVNKITGDRVDLLIGQLELCSDSDYFERGIELAVEQGLRIFPVNVSDLLCVEVDDPEDLARANELLLAHEQRS